MLDPVPVPALPTIRLGNKVTLFVEPSPFSHISGMKNRFECLIKGLRDAGDTVTIVTPDPQPPAEFCGAKVRGAPPPLCLSAPLDAPHADMPMPSAFPPPFPRL